MVFKLGIRREDKNKWERRTPLTPFHVKMLREKFEIETIIQPSAIRVFKDEEYKKAGAEINEDLSDASVVFAVKEIPINFFKPNKTYVFFSHTTKGQHYNMPMLKKMMSLECNLIDYEKITDEKNRRLVFFGRYAGLAGMVDTLWALGQRLKENRISNPFSEVKQTKNYHDLNEIKKHLMKISEKIKNKGFPKNLTPFVVGLAGYGNVSRGAQEIIDLFPVREINPSQLKEIYEKPSNKTVYKVVFKEKHLVEPIPPRREFDLNDYYNNPQSYRSVFEKYLPCISVFMNCIYWDDRYPRLITKKYLKNNFRDENSFHPLIIGDISADVNGAVEITEKTTDPGNPVFVYNPLNGKIKNGYLGTGVPVLAVDNLPCEIPRDSSIAFSEAIFPFVPHIMKADFNEDFEKLVLPPEVKKAVVLHQGKLTSGYEYMNKFL